MAKQVSKEEAFNFIKSEYIRCKLDPVYFLKTYCYISHPTKGRIKFNLFPFQEDIIRAMVQYDNVICNKSRQLGLSTVISGLSLWMMLFNSDINIVAVATKQQTAISIITKVKLMYNNLPAWLTNDSDRAAGKKGSNVVDDNKLSLKLRNNSQIKALSASKDAVRSEAVSILILDEAAFIRDIDEIYKAAYPALSTGGKIIAISSPNGVGNWFHKTFTDAQAGENDYLPVLLPWTVHPERDEEWLLRQTRNMSEEEVDQEFKCSFLAAGNRVINKDSMDYIESCIQEPKERRGISAQDLWIWEEPKQGKQYVLVADVSRGDGRDYSSFHVFDIQANVQVAELRSKLPPTELARLIVSVGYEYNTALVVVENTGLSWATVEQVINMHYPNLYYTVKGADHIDYNEFTRKYAANNKVPGFSMTPRVRPLVIGKLQEYTRHNSVTIRSARTRDELSVFIWHNSKAQAMNGYNDDLVVPLGTYLYVRDTYAEFMLNYDNSTRQMISNIQKTEYLQVYNSNQHGNNPWQMKLNNNHVEDISWILS